MNKNFLKKVGVVMVLGLLLIPSLSLAAESQDSQDGKTGITYECAGNGDCTFGDLVNATKKAVDWGIKFALGFSVVVLAWIGFKYMTSGGNPGELKKIREMAWNWVIGMCWVLGAWLVVTLITGALLNPGISTILSN